MADIASLQRANHGSHFRAFGLRGVPGMINPFLGVDHAWMSGPTFPPHSHSGFSAVSYLFLDSETGIINRDSVGNHNLIRPGGLHWATAGSGIVHEEVPAENGKTVHSLQIFVNLPAELRHMEPYTLKLEPQDVPVVQLPGVRIRVPAGSFKETRSPLKLPTDVTILDISLDDSVELNLSVRPGHRAFIMPIFGTVSIDGENFGYNDLRLPIYPEQDDPQIITLHASRGNSKVMLFSGRPLN
ncbi:TPA: pirin family protein [Klebsiella pneumoniae]